MATILVVDDSAELRLVFRCALSSCGHSILEANDGVEAIQVIRQKEPDLILIDLNMPLLDGLTTLRVLKNHPSYDRIKVVLTTANVNEEVKDQALATGCDWFLAKPFTIEQLRKCVAELLSGEEVNNGRF